MGDDEITGASISELRRMRLGIGMIFQQFNLVKRSSVLATYSPDDSATTSTWRSTLGYFREVDIRDAFANLDRVGIADKAYQRCGHALWRPATAGGHCSGTHANAATDAG